MTSPWTGRWAGFLGGSLAALLVAGGSTAGQAQDRQGGPARLPANLANSHWQLVEIQSMDDATGSRRPDFPGLYTLELGADGRASLRLNCNRASGRWTAQPAADGRTGSLRFGPLAMTRAFCRPPSLDAQLGRDLDAVRGFSLQGDQLALNLIADGGILLWQRLEGGPRNWRVSGGEAALRQEPARDARVLTRYASGTVLDNLGCGKGPEGSWCDVQQLGGGPRGYLPRRDLEPAVAPDGLVHYGQDDSALRAGQGRFDATGEVPCRLRTGQPMGRCPFGVARGGGGYATVVITLPDGRQRVIFFRMGLPIGQATSQASPAGAFQASRDADLSRISIGDERYEIPDAVVLGG
jgi:heat shock protein HslJ